MVAPARRLPEGRRSASTASRRKLGEGGIGAVYARRAAGHRQARAIKVLRASIASNPEMVSRFIAEARAVNQIRHRNIIDIFSFGQLAGRAAATS